MKAEEWLGQHQLFTGVEEAVLSRLAQCCQAEDVLKGQIIQSSAQKVQDLLILREGHAQQQGQLSEHGEQALCCCLVSSFRNRKRLLYYVQCSLRWTPALGCLQG